MNITTMSNSKEKDDHFLESGDRHNATSESKLRQLWSLSSNYRVLKTTMLFVVVAVTCILVLNQTSSIPSEFFQGSNLLMTSQVNHDEDVVLRSVLEKANMGNNTVIITTVNSAWIEPDSLFDLFLYSFKMGIDTEKLLKHIVIIAFDQIAYDRCLELELHCYALTTEGVDFSGEKVFMSEDYLKMMWRRLEFLRTILVMGYNFVFTDADVMWFRDPFPRFYPEGDFQIACDHYRGDNYSDTNNSPNGGYYYVRSSNRTIKFYEFWYWGRSYNPGRNEQDVLNMIKTKPYIKEIGLDMRFLETTYFGGFCEPGKDLDLAITMHANCCVGLKNKIHDIKIIIDDWQNYYDMSLAAKNGGEMNMTLRSWSHRRICGR